MVSSTKKKIPVDWKSVTRLVRKLKTRDAKRLYRTIEAELNQRGWEYTGTEWIYTRVNNPKLKKLADNSVRVR